MAAAMQRNCTLSWEISSTALGKRNKESGLKKVDGDQAKFRRELLMEEGRRETNKHTKNNHLMYQQT